MAKVSLQAHADETLAEKYRQLLKTAAQVIDANGWGDPDAPQCCGTPVAVKALIGDPYYAECETCGKFAVTADAPRFGKASVQFLDPEKIDLDTDARWIVGVKEPA